MQFGRCMSETYSVLPLLTLAILIPPSEILRTGTLVSLILPAWFYGLLRKVKGIIKIKKEGNINAGGFFSTLQKIPHIGKTKIGELAKSFVWDPFFPVNLEDTLFQVLLLLSKHRLQVVPVIALSESKIVGFVTQIAVIHMLLQSCGLEWFDNIAGKALSEFRFVNDERVASIYEDQSIAEVIHVLWENRVVAIAVVQRKTQRLVGCVRSSDVYLLLDDDILLINRKSLTVGHFIRTHSSTVDSDTTIEWDLGALLSFATLTLKKQVPPENGLASHQRGDRHAQASYAKTGRCKGGL